jgi:hypothetical protein
MHFQWKNIYIDFSRLHSKIGEKLKNNPVWRKRQESERSNATRDDRTVTRYRASRRVPTDGRH